eukprot:gene951-1448_t
MRWTFLESWFQKSEDALTDLTSIASRIDGMEIAVRALKSRVTTLKHAGVDPEERAALKIELICDWDEMEERLLAICRELACICGGDTSQHRIAEHAKRQAERVEALLNEGSTYIMHLSAMVKVVSNGDPMHTQHIPEAFATDAWIIAVAQLEANETRCRFEYEKGECMLRDEHERQHRARANALRGSCRGGIAELSHQAPLDPRTRPSHSSPPPPSHSHRDAPSREAGRPALPVDPPAADAPPFRQADMAALPWHWSRTAWASQRNELVDITAEMRGRMSRFFEGTGSVLHVSRVESIRLWSGYACKRESVYEQRRDVARHGELVVASDLMPQGEMPVPDALSDGIRERWLFLPCRSEKEARGFAAAGLAGARKPSGLFGPALYLYESAADVNNKVGGAEPVVILVRAVVGKHYAAASPEPSMAAPPAGHHSVIALCKSPSGPLLLPGPSAAAWLTDHREFVFHDSALCYPAYIVRYKRAPASM